MKWIKQENAEPGQNSEVCKTIEYSFGDNEIDLGVATIKGRFPEKGYAMNEVSRELVYVLEGAGVFGTSNETFHFSKGDSILILPHEKYYYDSPYCVLSLTCTPAWSKEQHKVVEE